MAKRKRVKEFRKLPKSEKLKRYRSRIEAAQGFRRQENLDDLWRRLNDLYRGKQLPPEMSKEDAFVVNVAFATINVIAPSVAVNYPTSTVTAVSPEHLDQAVIAEAVINYWWRKHKVLTPFQQSVKDFLIYGFGWIKEGWRFIEEAEADEEALRLEFDARREELDAFAVDRPDLAGDLPTDDDLLAEIEAEGVGVKWKIVEDAPFVERVSPHDVFVDPEATSMADLRWIAHRSMKTYEELANSAGYNERAVKDIEADAHMPDDWFTAKPFWSGDERPKDDLDRYTVWEFWDLITGQMCVFADGGDQFLVEPTDFPYAFGHPFVMLRNYEVPEQFYPMGELEALEPLQHELNLTRTAMFNDRKNFRRRHLYNPQAFDRVGKAALESDEDNVLIPVNPGVPLGEAIIAMPGQTPNPQLYQDSALIEDDITRITGVSEYQQGALPEIRRTATEAAIIQDVANARAADKLAKVEWAISEISRRMLILAQSFLHEGQAARIASRKSGEFYFHFEPEDIQGEFDFEVVGGSTRPKNEQQRRQQALDMLQALAPFGDPQMGLINMQEVIAHALKHGFDVDDPERFMGGGPQGPPLGAPEEAMMGPAGPPQGGAPALPPMQEPQMDPTQMALADAGIDPMAAAAQLQGQVGLDLQGGMF